MRTKSGIKNVFLLIVVCITICCTGCSFSANQTSDQMKEEDILLEIGEYSLSRGQVESVIPRGLSQLDSTLAAESYIKLWIKDQLVFEKAEDNLRNDETIKELVDNYRHSLLVFTYQERLLKERLLKTVSDRELEDYYSENIDQFKLSNNIVRGIFLVVPLSSSQLGNFKKWYKNSSDIEKIEEAYLQNARTYEYFYDRWVNFEEIIDKIPVNISDVSSFLKANKYIEIQDSTELYLLNIRDYKLQDEIAPFEYARQKALNIILGQRKASFMADFEEDLYQEALQKKKIKFYYKTEDLIH